jgi:pheromone shutdown protein TraB
MLSCGYPNTGQLTFFFIFRLTLTPGLAAKFKRIDMESDTADGVKKNREFLRVMIQAGRESSPQVMRVIVDERDDVMAKP